MQTYAQTNLQTADGRLNHKPAPRTCDICIQVPAVRRVTRRMEGGEYWTANCCAMCAEKVGK